MCMFKWFRKDQNEKVIFDKNWFSTTKYGGIGLNVIKLREDNIRHFDVDIKCEYLKNLTIDPKHSFNITGFIILVSNFGVVDGHDLFKNVAGHIKKQIFLYEFKDAYPYFYDKAGMHDRLQKIYKLNLPKFEPILIDILGEKK